jgi:hypothetical protein
MVYSMPISITYPLFIAVSHDFILVSLCLALASRIAQIRATIALFREFSYHSQDNQGDSL